MQHTGGSGSLPGSNGGTESLHKGKDMWVRGRVSVSRGCPCWNIWSQQEGEEAWMQEDMGWWRGEGGGRGDADPHCGCLYLRTFKGCSQDQISLTWPAAGEMLWDHSSETTSSQGHHVPVLSRCQKDPTYTQVLACFFQGPEHPGTQRAESWDALSGFNYTGWSFSYFCFPGDDIHEN